MTNVERLCAEVIEASERAPKLPYRVDHDFFLIESSTRQSIANLNEISANGMEYIILSANNAPKLARALIIAKKALGKIGASCGEVDSTEACWLVLAVHKQALADIDEILK